MSSGWRRILGWVLTVLGVLVALFGLIAILGSSEPGVTDPAGARTGGVVFIVVGLVVAAAGIYLLLRAARNARVAKRIVLTPEQRQLAVRRQLRNSLLIYSAGSLLALLVGLFSYLYSQSLASDVASFESAVSCTTNPGASNCYQLRNVSITSVDVTHNRQGETDRVKFLDAGSSFEVSIQPGNLDSSVLRTGAAAVATLWRGRYTNLEVAGTSFATADNPVGQRDEYRTIALIGIVIGLLTAGAIPLGVRGLRRLGGQRAAAELLPGQGGSDSDDLTVSYPGLPFLIRPRPLSKRVPWWVLLILPGFLLLTYVSVSPYGPASQWTFTSLAALCIALLVAWNLLTNRNSHLFVDDMTFGAVDAFGRRRSWPRSEAARIVRRTVQDTSTQRRPYDVVIVVGTDDRARLRVMTQLYGRNELRQYASALGVPFDESLAAVPVSRAELTNEIPASGSWLSRHSVAAGVLLAVVLITVLSAVAVLTSGPNHR